MPDEQLLHEQVAYYRAVAPEYETTRSRAGRRPRTGAALDAFHPAGGVLELACGPGHGPSSLLRHATSLTAVDAPRRCSPPARRRRHGRVRFVQADLFGWRPDRRYDVVFFGFWLSHVPLDRFGAFWWFVAGA